MKQIIKIEDSGIWAIISVLFWIGIILATSTDAITRSIDNQTKAITQCNQNK